MMNLSRRTLFKTAAVAATASVVRRTFASQPMTIPGDKEPVGDFGFATLPVDTKKVGEGVYVLAGPGGNVTLALGKNNEPLIIDTGVPGRTADLLTSIKALSGGTAPATIINTHWHFDHAGGNEAFAAAGAKAIVAHYRTFDRMSVPQHNDFFGLDFPASPESARPNITFPDSVVLHHGAHTLTATHMPPAHTDTDVFVNFAEANVLSTGDLFSNGSFPFIDAGTGGSLPGMISSAAKLLEIAKDTTTLVPGHGPIATRKDLVAFRDMLHTVRDRLQPFAEKKATLDEVLAAKPLNDFNANWGKRFFHASHFTRICYPTLMK